MAFTANPQGQPGVFGPYISQPRTLIWSDFEKVQRVSVPLVIDGVNSSWATNSPYNWLLPAGMIFGRETSSKKYAPSIIGLTSAPVGGSQTTLTTDPNTASYLNTRIGASGTFNIQGPPTPGGVTRGQVATYSAVNTTTGAITITALGVGAVSPVNQINNLVVVDNTGVGTFNITVEGITTTTPVTYSATAATLVTNINTRLDATFGTSAIVASGASLAAIILTFSGTGYSARPVGTVTTTPVVNAGGTTYTINGNGAVGVATVSPVGTAGVTAVAAQSGEYVAGSLIQPTDGSQNILWILGDDQGVAVIDGFFNRIDAQTGQMLSGGGCINTGFIVNYPSDSSLKAYIKAALRANASGFTFLDDFTG